MIHQLRNSHYFLSEYFENVLGMPLSAIMKENPTKRYNFIKCNRILKTSQTTARHPILENKRVGFWGVVQDIQPGYERRTVNDH